MKNHVGKQLISYILVIVIVLSITGCATQPQEDSHVTTAPAVASAIEELTTDESEQAIATTKEQTVPTPETEQPTEITPTDVPEPSETIPNEPSDELNETQKNSIAMLNYLATLTQEIDASRNSRLFLEEAYASLINNTNPETVNELTESHLSSLLDIIEKYRMITVKRQRLQYIYEQNKAKAIRSALPNPIGLLSAVQAFDIKKAAAAALYMAVDSATSYKDYQDSVSMEYLQSGWELDDEEAANLHDSRKRAFMFMVEIVREDNLPGDLALSEAAVNKFVEWKSKSNTVQKIQFFKDEEQTYHAFGLYWIELAKCYYENEDYESCLDAIEKYEELMSNIFRVDYYYAQIIPIAISAASMVYAEAEYIQYATEKLEALMDNIDKTDSTEWALRYFAAETYIDLSNKTGDKSYLEKAYSLAVNNVNVLVEKQKELNSTYLNDVQELTIPDGATSEEKKNLKEYNKRIKKDRETELAPIYQPLAVNCELLFALSQELNKEYSERKRINDILIEEGQFVFLTENYKAKYALDYEPKQCVASFSEDEIAIPVEYLSEPFSIRVTVSDNGTRNVYTDWEVDEVKREGSGIETFTAIIKSDAIDDQEWSEGSEVTVEIIDGNTNTAVFTMNYEVDNYSSFLLWTDVEFEQVN